MREWHDVGSLGALERDGRLIARIGGRELGVLLVDGEVRGVRNRCPHHGGPLCFGTVEERVEGSPGGYALAGRRILRCPWHGWEFDLETGVCVDDPKLRVAVYPARLDEDRVQIEA